MNKATELIAVILKHQKPLVAYIIERHPITQKLANIPDSEIDQLVPEIEALFHEWKQSADRKSAVTTH